MNPRRVVVPVIVLVVAAVAGGWALHRRAAPDAGIVLYGDVDVRESQLAFDDAGRIASIAVHEGDRVAAGQTLASLDPTRYRDAVDRARAALAAQRAVLERLRHGSRPEEVEAARADVDAARAAVANAEATFARQRTLVDADFLPRQALDDATQARQTAAARLQRAQQELALARQGPRREDLAAAAAQVDADTAALALAQRQLSDTVLRAPRAGVIQDRILEPGDMAAPQTPVLTLAVDDPVWVRAYVPETRLGQVRPGMAASIRSDSWPGRTFAGWVGFISPTAEFTPKSVETTELRSQLVYRVRVYACNGDGALRLGMPVTVRLEPGAAAGAHVCR